MHKKTEKTYQNIQKRFNQGCVTYGLLEDGDRILIGLSGGKDSMMLTRLMALRARIFKPRIEVEAVHVVMDNIAYEMDYGWMETFCRSFGIKLNIVHTNFEVRADAEKTPCFLCSWHRRKALFGYATEHGFNKVALGHHQDDILTTWLMNISFEGNAQPSMLPKLKMEHYPITIIRPLCLVSEQLLREESAMEGLVHEKRACPYEKETMRTKMNGLFKQLDEMSPEVRHSMWQALMGMRGEICDKP